MSIPNADHGPDIDDDEGGAMYKGISIGVVLCLLTVSFFVAGKQALKRTDLGTCSSSEVGDSSGATVTLTCAENVFIYSQKK